MHVTVVNVGLIGSSDPELFNDQIRLPRNPSTGGFWFRWHKCLRWCIAWKQPSGLGGTLFAYFFPQLSFVFDLGHPPIHHFDPFCECISRIRGAVRNVKICWNYISSKGRADRIFGESRCGADSNLAEWLSSQSSVAGEWRLYSGAASRVYSLDIVMQALHAALVVHSLLGHCPLQRRWSCLWSARPRPVFLWICIHSQCPPKTSNFHYAKV